jgi:hypothetical protein
MEEKVWRARHAGETKRIVRRKVGGGNRERIVETADLGRLNVPVHKPSTRLRDYLAIRR